MLKNFFKSIQEKQRIKKWLNQYKITNYELIKNEKYFYVVNVNESVFLENQNLKSIEIKFHKVNGDFYCSKNQLKSLECCPEIVNGSFNCNSNKLETLKDSPEIINGFFDCSYNELTTLEGCPEIINGNFYCYENKLETLKGCPKIIRGLFICSNNNLSINSLKELPDIVEDDISIYYNEKLGDIQAIDDINKLKEKLDEILKIKEEKEKLLSSINKEELNKKNKRNTMNKL